MRRPLASLPDRPNPGQLDAGPVWAAETFAMREATKASLYRNEVTAGAARAVVAAVQRFAKHRRTAGHGRGGQGAAAAATDETGRPSHRLAARRHAARYAQDPHRRWCAGCGRPSVGEPCHLFDAWRSISSSAPPGCVIGRRHEAVLRATVDGAVWIGHVRRADPGRHQAAGGAGLSWPRPRLARMADRDRRAGRLRRAGARSATRPQGGVGYLHFAFYNGAMSTAQCERLTAALRFALARPDRVLVLLGGPDFWSNGIHLNVIEAADSPADESWRNINAIDDLTRTLIEATDRVVIAAMQGNAGAGGVFMALAADQVWARRGVVLNPHYKNMGNLYGSEYWTYLLPRRLKAGTVGDVMGQRLPMSASQAANGPGRRGLRRRAHEVRRRRARAGARRSPPAPSCRRCCAPSRRAAEPTKRTSRSPPTATRNSPACTATSTASTRATTSHARISCAVSRRRGRRATWRSTGGRARLSTPTAAHAVDKDQPRVGPDPKRR